MNYLNPFDNNDISSYTVYSFGEYVRQRREELDISVREMARRLGMSAMYLSDIERGKRPAPSGSISGKDYMSILENELNLTDSQKEVFRLMAEISHLSTMNLIDNYFSNNPSALKFFLNAIQKEMSNEKWEKLYQLMFD